MVIKTNCKGCSDFLRWKGKHCNMSCSLKGVIKIYPETFSMKQISSCLENNIGCKINESKISEYSKEIKLLIGE